MTTPPRRVFLAKPFLAVLLTLGPVAPQMVWAAQAAAQLALERDAVAYRSHIEFLANPFMEGRGPGTRGNEIAAQYIEHAMQGFGMHGAFDSDPDKPGEAERQRRIKYVYRQGFTAGTRAELKTAAIGATNESRKDGAFVTGGDFAVLGFSASTSVSAPLVFAGYSIEKGGPGGAYSSFSKDGGDAPLQGKIAIVLRFEPMDGSGKSLWRKKEDTLWTSAAALPEKLQAAVKRGAAGIILVSPPGADDPRTKKLETTEGSSRWMQPLEIPVLMMSEEAVDGLVRARDAEHRTLRQLRELADAGAVVVPLGAEPVAITTQIDRSPRTTWNVAATLPGRGALASQYVVVGAHYDHVGYGYTGGSRSDEYGVVHPGADDNASGASGLLLAAEILRKKYEAPGDANLRSIMFIAFSAEEMGLIGSREFMKASPIEAKNIDAMLNMDMIGRLRDAKLEVSGTGTAEGFAELLQPIFGASGLSVQASPGGRGPSDHATFYGAGIPVLHFYTGMHEQYHTPRDTVDLINVPGAVQVVHLVCDIAQSLAKRPEALVFKSTDKQGEKPDRPASPTLGGLKVRFGIAPGNYADGEAGILVGEVYPGTCAAEAGILTGDRLIRWNGKEIGDVQSWMVYLADHKPGDTVDVDVRRKGEDLRVRVTLKSRDQAPK